MLFGNLLEIERVDFVSSNFNANLDALFSKMENFISSKTVVGEPVTIGDITMLPLIDVSFGIGTGATGNKTDKDSKAKNAGGIGAKITPSAILVIQNGTVQLVNVKNTGNVDKLLNMVPGILSKFNLDFMKKNEKTEDEAEESNE